MKKLNKNTVLKNEKLHITVFTFVCKPEFCIRLFENTYLHIRLVLSMLCLIAGFITKAQLPEYYVYLIKGRATIKEINGKTLKVKQHHLLHHDDILRLKTGAELTLVDKDANFILLKSAGNYKVDTLYNKNIRNPESITKKYLKLLWHELLEPTEDYAVFKKESLTELSGGVSRGGKKCDNLIFPINGLKISEDTIHFVWLQTNHSGIYNFTISDEKGKKLELPVSDTRYIVKTSAIFGQQTGKYCWLVKGIETTPETGKDSTCENKVPACFELITKENEVRLVSSLVPENISNDLAMQLSIVNQLEKNALIYSAINFYTKIIKANPENKALLKSYIFFLLKYGFNEEALSAWNDLKK
jgi:hypothetical protein